jgi:hypothetical protein
LGEYHKKTRRFEDFTGKMWHFGLHQELYCDGVQLLFAGEKTIFAESQERFLEKWPASWHCSLDLTSALQIDI